MRVDSSVWYVSYGSNMARERFLCYLSGGTPAGSSRAEVGCRDRSPPRDCRVVRLPYRLYFSGDSSHWGPGGVAFIEPAGDSTDEVIARMYLISAGQFMDVVNQENRIQTPFRLEMDLDEMESLKTVRLPFRCEYDELHCMGYAEPFPMWTFTASRKGPVCPPADAYLRTIVAGLVEMGLTDLEVEGYLGRAEGIDAKRLSALIQNRAQPPASIPVLRRPEQRD